MGTRSVAVLAGLIMLAAPALADENESSEITLPRVDATALSALPHSVAPETEALAVPEPEWTPIAPVSGCRREHQDTVYLTN